MECAQIPGELAQNLGKEWIHTTLARSSGDKLASGSTSNLLPRSLGASLCEVFSMSTILPSLCLAGLKGVVDAGRAGLR